VSNPNSNASALVRALVSAGQSDLPAPERIDGVWARLGPLSAAPASSGDVGGAASGDTAAAGAAGATAQSAAALKLAAGLLLGVAVAGGAVVGARRARAPHAPQGLHAPRAAVGASPPLAVAPAPSASAEDVAVPVTSLPFAAPPTMRPSVALASASPAASVNLAPQAPPAQQEAPFESEISLLQAAKAALRDDPAAALALADRHARRFDAGALAQEREVIAIEALVALGRAADARDRGGRFERDFPQSAHRLRIESLLSAGDHNR
jgi:hypothetical protein